VNQEINILEKKVGFNNAFHYFVNDGISILCHPGDLPCPAPAGHSYEPQGESLIKYSLEAGFIPAGLVAHHCSICW